jgi:hypothetical protein
VLPKSRFACRIGRLRLFFSLLPDLFVPFAVKRGIAARRAGHKSIRINKFEIAVTIPKGLFF